jgi:hypothetical protein
VRPHPAVVALVTGMSMVLAGGASAQEGIFGSMQKGIDFTSSSVSTTTTFASGLVTRTESRNLFPTLTLNADTLLYPSLRLNAGGVFELNVLSTTTDRLETNSTITRNRPFLLLRSTNPVFSPGVGYFRREERARTAGLSNVKLVNDEYAAYLGWNPAGGPRSDFQFLRTHTFDGAHSFQDVTKGFGTLISNYNLRNFGMYYQGSFLDTDDRLRTIESRQTTQAARLSDAETFFRKRLVWNGTYNINHQDLRTTSAGTTGDVDVPITAFAGLSGLSDLPDTALLSPNAALIDGNLTAGAGVSLGVAVAPQDPQARNIGLDFLNRTEVNRLLLWVDRDLTAEVAGSFAFQIYSSTDNIVWKREFEIPVAAFGPFENRFEILFPAVTARYIKVVTKPLSVAVPNAARFTDLFVTELQAFSRRSAADIKNHLTQTTHVVNTDVRLRLLDAPSLYYEGFLLYNGPDTFGASTKTVSNGLSVNHAFARVLSAYGRAAREQGWDPRGDRIATVTNGTLTVDPIPAFRTSLLYTGQQERIDGTPNDRWGLFVQNSAQLYRGVNVLFGIGWNATNRETGEIAHDRLVNASATVVPRQHISLTFSVDRTATDRSGIFVGAPHTTAQRLYAAVAVDPLPTLHLVLGEEVVAAANQRTRTTHDVGVNWAPFPGGALQLIFAYNESLRALEFGTDASTLGAVRWNLSRKSYVDVSFQRTRSEFVTQRTASRVFSISVRLWA